MPTSEKQTFTGARDCSSVCARYIPFPSYYPTNSISSFATAVRYLGALAIASNSLRVLQARRNYGTPQESRYTGRQVALKIAVSQ